MQVGLPWPVHTMASRASRVTTRMAFANRAARRPDECRKTRSGRLRPRSGYTLRRRSNRRRLGRLRVVVASFVERPYPPRRRTSSHSRAASNQSMTEESARPAPADRGRCEAIEEPWTNRMCLWWSPDRARIFPTEETDVVLLVQYAGSTTLGDNAGVCTSFMIFYLLARPQCYHAARSLDISLNWRFTRRLPFQSRRSSRIV